MKKIKLDTGITTVALGSGMLRFHPADPNLYVRFQEAVDKLQAVETELVARATDADGQTVARLLAEADRQMKELLNWVFGPGNEGAAGMEHCGESQNFLRELERVGMTVRERELVARENLLRVLA